MNGNALVLASNVDLANKASYSVRLRAADPDGLSTEQSFVITVSAVNVAPTAINLSSNQIAEDIASGSAVGQLSSTDTNAGDTHTYALVSGTGDTDNAAFSIVGNELRTAAGFNFENQSTHSIRVRTTDSSNLSFEQVLQINVTNVNESPSQLQLSSTSVVDGTASGQTAATLSAADPDSGDTLTYSLVSGTGDTDNADFTINGNALVLADVDMAAKASYTIRLRATDAGGLSTEQTFAITVTEVPDAPTGVDLSITEVAENLAAGTVVGQLSSTDTNAGDTHTYALVTGTGDTDNASFEIVGNELRTKAVFDFEAQATYSVRIRTTDSAGLMFEQAYTVTITDANDARLP